MEKPRLPILILTRKPQIIPRLINKHRRLPERLAARCPSNLAGLVEQLQRLAEMTVVVVMHLARGAAVDTIAGTRYQATMAWVYKFWPDNLARWRKSVDRQRVLELLRESKPSLQAQFGVTQLALFGSTARGTAEPESDVDVLVGFDGPATSKRYFGVQFFLEDLLGCPVDLVTEKAVRSELRPYIEQDRVNV